MFEYLFLGWLPSDDAEWLLWIEGIKTAATALTAVGLLFTYLSLRRTTRQHQVTVLSDIQESWIKIYPTRNTLLATDYRQIAWDELDYQDILARPEWLEVVGPVANFYEFLGLLVHQKYVRPEVLFVLVTVDKNSRRNADPLISQLRETYRGDLYIYWDYLLKVWEQTPAKAPPGWQASTKPKPVTKFRKPPRIRT